MYIRLLHSSFVQVFAHIFTTVTNRLAKFPLVKRDWIVIAFVWAVIQIIFFWNDGINDSEEAIKYIRASREFLAGTKNFSLHDIWYSGYMLLHVLIAMLGLPPKGMYVLQLILSFLSLVYFVRILSIWIEEKLILLLSALLYATCLIIQQWVTQLYTDTVFYMLLVIGTYYIATFHSSRQNKTICCLFVLLLPIFRPVGFLFVLLACIHWSIIAFYKNRRLIFAGITYSAILLFLALCSLNPSDGYFYPLHNAEANIICGFQSELIKYQSKPYQPNESIYLFLWNNPELTARLFAARLIKVFDLTRPYFSTLHNIAIAISIVIYYCLAAFGIYSILKNKQADRLFLIFGVLLFTVPSIIFCVEWHGRMSLPTICYILILSGLGIDVIVKKLFGRHG